MKRNYDEVGVVRSLNKKTGVMVNMNTKTINVEIGATTIGNGSWGKIDYLIHYHDYVVIRVNHVNGKRAHLYSDDEATFNGKRNKINLASMVKSALKTSKK